MSIGSSFLLKKLLTILSLLMYGYLAGISIKSLPILVFSSDKSAASESGSLVQGEFPRFLQHPLYSALDQNPNADESWLRCPFCPHLSANSYGQKQHMSEWHPDRLPFSCNICHKGFISYSGMFHHRRTHSERKYMCKVCDSRFVLKHHLKNHMIRVHKMPL